MFEPSQLRQVILVTRIINECKNQLSWHCQLCICSVDWALRQCMFYSTCMETDTSTDKYVTPTRAPLPPRGPSSSTCFWAPSPDSTCYSVWFTVLYLWANGPKLSARQKAHRCTLKVHHDVTHIAQPLSTAKGSSPQTLIVSMVHCCTWPPTLNMEMLWKQNLNIYIRWLWKRGYALLFIQLPCCMYFLCSGWGGESEEGGGQGDWSAQSGERQPSGKVKTVHQQIRQRCTIHHVRGGRAQIETSKIINTGEPCHQGLSIP